MLKYNRQFYKITVLIVVSVMGLIGKFVIVRVALPFSAVIVELKVPDGAGTAGGPDADVVPSTPSNILLRCLTV